MRPGQAGQESRRARAQADKLAAELADAKRDAAQAFTGLAARIGALEAQMAVVLDALPRIKELPVG